MKYSKFSKVGKRTKKKEIDSFQKEVKANNQILDMIKFLILKILYY